MAQDHRPQRAAQRGLHGHLGLGNHRRASSPYLLSGLLKCETCGKALTAAEAKTFEKLIVDKIRANILTQSNIPDLVKLLDEEMDGVASEQRERLENIEDVKRRLSRIWQVIETTDIEMADAQDMSEFLNESELTERRPFIETFVKEIVVMPGDALLRYTIAMTDDSPIPGRNAEEMALNGSVLSTVKNGGPERTVLSPSQKYADPV